MKKWVNVLLFLIVVALVVYVLKDVNFLEVYGLLKKINIFYFFLAFLCCFINLLFWNLRWQNSISSFTQVKFWFLLKVLLAGVFINTVTPGGNIGGEPIRAYFLGKKYNKPKSKFFATTLVEKVLNLFAFGFFIFFSLFFIFMYLKVPSGLKWTLGIGTIFLFLTSAVFSFFLFRKEGKGMEFLRKLYGFKFIQKRFTSAKSFKEYFRKRMDNISIIFKKIMFQKRIFFMGVFYSFLMWIFHFLVAYFLFLAFGAEVRFTYIIIAVTIAYLIGDISLFPGGIGLMESSMFLLYSAVGIPHALAAVVALLTRIIYYFYYILIGGLMLWHLKATVK